MTIWENWVKVNLANFKGYVKVYFTLSTIGTSCTFKEIVHSHVNFPVAHYGLGNGPNLRTRKSYIGRDMD